MKLTKAEILRDLFNLNSNLKFEIPKVLVFKHSEWKKNKDRVIQDIQKTFKRRSLAIRSSAQDEDKDNSTNAGKFKS